MFVIQIPTAFIVDIKRSILLPDRPSPALVLEMPIETCEGAMLLTFVLQKQGTLLNAKFLQRSGKKIQKILNTVVN